MTKLFILLLLVVSSIFLTSCTQKVDEITVNCPTVSIKVGEFYNVSYTTKPNTPYGEDVLIIVEDKTVADEIMYSKDILDEYPRWETFSIYGKAPGYTTFKISAQVGDAHDVCGIMVVE